MMLVSVSGVHSTRMLAFHRLFRPYCWLTLLENEPTRLTKFSDEFFVPMSLFEWFQRTLPSIFSVSFFS